MSTDKEFYENLRYQAMNNGGTYYPRTQIEFLDGKDLFDAIYKSYSHYPWSKFEIHCSKAVVMRIKTLLNRVQPALNILELYCEVVVFEGEAEQVFIKQKLDWIPDGSISLIERV